jgi:hypothetical protein
MGRGRCRKKTEGGAGVSGPSRGKHDGGIRLMSTGNGKKNCRRLRGQGRRKIRSFRRLL